jgi:hypothetical protein
MGRSHPTQYHARTVGFISYTSCSKALMLIPAPYSVSLPWNDGRVVYVQGAAIAFGEFGHGVLGFLFSFPKIGVLVAIALASRQR